MRTLRAVRSPPDDLRPELIEEVLARGWAIRASTMEYIPEGGGSHHWQLRNGHGRLHFVTIDDLDNKEWLGHSRDVVFEGLRRALDTAAALGRLAGLEFVVSALAAGDGRLLHRVDDRYALSVFPYLAGRSFPFGPYPDPRLCELALDSIARLHLSTPSVREVAPCGELSYSGREDLDAFLQDPARPWDGGPFAEPARQLLAAQAPELCALVADFDRLATQTARTRSKTVITHGEPHPANLMMVDERVVLIDWDTVALAPAERDLSLLTPAPPASIERYERTTGHGVDATLMFLYRLRWYLDDVASTVRLFRPPHHDNADTRRWWSGVAPLMQQLPRWRSGTV